MFSKIDLQEDWKILPDKELKRIFKNYERKQKLIASIPVWILLPSLVVYGFMGYLCGFAAAHHGFLISFSLWGAIDFVCFAGCGGLMASSNRKNFVVVPIIMGLEIFFNSDLTESFNLVKIIMFAYVLIGCMYLSKVVKQMNLLRTHPHFPFDERRQEIQFEAMTRKQMVNYLERVNDGGVQFVGYEEIFNSDNPEEIVNEMKNPTISEEDKLQIHGYQNRKNNQYIKNKAKSLENTNSMCDEGEFLQTRFEYENFTPEEIQRITRKFASGNKK